MPNVHARPLCEPVDLPAGFSLRVEAIRLPPDAPAADRFLHFHDVAELVVFDAVEGEFLADGRRWPLRPGAIVFVPSMTPHDFVLTAGAKGWVLIQLEPFQIRELEVRPGYSGLGQTICTVPHEPVAGRIRVLIDWLLESAPETRAPHTGAIVELLMNAVSSLAEDRPAPDRSAPRHRLHRAVEQLGRAPGEPFSLEAAAALCRLSPAHFSRSFKRTYGEAFSDYVRVYRLHLAARRIAIGRESFSEIAYSLGFASPSHFAARFKDRFGMTPRQYRRVTGARSTVR